MEIWNWLKKLLAPRPDGQGYGHDSGHAWADDRSRDYSASVFNDTYFSDCESSASSDSGSSSDSDSSCSSDGGGGDGGGGD